MSEFDDAVKYILGNLNIEISQDTDFGPVERISIKLKIGDSVISEDSCPLPDPVV